MSSYIDTSIEVRMGFQRVRVITHSWTDDARARLKWLYGSPDARIEANRPDLARWNALGRARAA